MMARLCFDWIMWFGSWPECVVFCWLIISWWSTVFWVWCLAIWPSEFFVGTPSKMEFADELCSCSCSNFPVVDYVLWCFVNRLGICFIRSFCCGFFISSCFYFCLPASASSNSCMRLLSPSSDSVLDRSSWCSIVWGSCFSWATLSPRCPTDLSLLWSSASSRSSWTSSWRSLTPTRSC